MAIKAFLCSISEYSFAGQLPFCKNESKLVADVLASNLNIHNKDIFFATETGNITHFEYMKKFKEFTSTLTTGDIVIIYHSGHGSIDDEYNDLLLCATNSANPETSIPSVNLAAYLSMANIQNAIYLIDCCYSGLGIENVKTIADIEESILKQIGSGSAIITSCSKNQLSYPFDNYSSVFTKILIDSINSRFSYKDGYFDLNEFKNMIMIYSKAWNKMHPDKIQNPLFKTNMFGMLRIPVTATHIIQENDNILDFDCDSYSLYDIKQDIKHRDGSILHTVNVTALLKYDYDETNLLHLIQQIVDYICSSEKYENSNVIWLYVCIVLIWICIIIHIVLFGQTNNRLIGKKRWGAKD